MTEKSLPQPTSPQVRSRTLTPYVIGWTALAGISLLYLTLLATQPATVSGYLAASDETAAKSEPTPAEAAIKETVAEVRTLRDTIDLFRNELIELRAQVSNQTDASRDIATRLAKLEAPAPAEERVAAEASAKDKAAQAKAAKAKGAEPAQQQAAADQKAAKDEKKKMAKAAEKRDLETGSVATPAAGAISFGPPTVTTATVPPAEAAAATSRQVGVQIATGPSVDSLRLSWTLLNERHGTTLGALQPRYTTDVSGNGQTYDLVIGPVANVDEARKLCQELALKATPCQVTRYTGDAL